MKKQIIFIFILVLFLPIIMFGNEITVDNTSALTEWYQIFLLVYFIMAIATIFKGYGENRSLILYRDYNDLGLTFLVTAAPILIYLLFVSFGGNPQFGFILAFIVFIILLGILIKDPLVLHF